MLPIILPIVVSGAVYKLAVQDWYEENKREHESQRQRGLSIHRDGG